MAHLLIIDLPGGNDTDIIRSAMASGHTFCFLSSDLAHYRRQPQVWAYLSKAVAQLELEDFSPAPLIAAVGALHQRQPIDAVLSLIDIRLVAAAQVSKHLGCVHISPDCAARMRDKYQVRCALREAALAQPDFELATSNEQARAAVERLGLPVLIKPADGYGSQNILSLRSPIDLQPWLSPFEHLLPSRTEYGLGVKANDRLLIERYMSGRLVGCDTFSVAGEHRLLGVHDKLMFEPPFFAIRGGCFRTPDASHAELQRYVFAALDAVGFDHGATHTEVMITDQGPHLVEINPRIVGAKIARLVGLTLGRDIYGDLIDLHLGKLKLDDWRNIEAGPRFGVTRWITSAQEGTLESIELPATRPDCIAEVELLKLAGDHVQPPFQNADRLGYVIAIGKDAQETSQQADAYVQDVHVHVHIDSPPHRDR